MTEPLRSKKTTADDPLPGKLALGAMAGVPTPGSGSLGTGSLGPENKRSEKLRVKWYRSPVPREELTKLNRRSDLLGFSQTLGFLAVLAASSGLAIYSFFHWHRVATALLIFLNGHAWHFLINGFHELIHDSVFKTRRLNRFFLRIFSFLGWYNHHHFWASHTEHHKYTLHPPDDLEVVQPEFFSVKNLIKTGIVNLKWPLTTIGDHLMPALGRIDPKEPWTQALFPESESQRRQAYFNWARIVLVGHALIAGISLAYGWWIVVLVINLPMMFGAWLHFFCNSSQHVGLCDRVADFRLCCRTIYLNPLFQFLYWHMNYHTEHHMYAAVPCYNLGKLHRLIKEDLPYCPNGLVETWKQIFKIQVQQQADPDYRYVAELPPPAPAQEG